MHTIYIHNRGLSPEKGGHIHSFLDENSGKLIKAEKFEKGFMLHAIDPNCLCDGCKKG